MISSDFKTFQEISRGSKKIPKDSKRFQKGSNEVSRESERFQEGYKRFPGVLWGSKKVPRGSKRFQWGQEISGVPKDSKRLQVVPRGYQDSK